MQAHYRPVGIDGKLKDLWVDVAAQTRRDAVAAALIKKETGVADEDTLARAANQRASPSWDRSDRDGGPCTCRWCGTSFGLTVWRYNCAACGWKVCGECSPNAMELTQWLEPREPHDLRHSPSNTALRVCKGCWYAAQATARGSSALVMSQSEGSDHATAVKELLLNREILQATLAELPREDLLLLVCISIEAASQRAADTSAKFLDEVSAAISCAHEQVQNVQPAEELQQAAPTVTARTSARESENSIDFSPCSPTGRGARGTMSPIARDLGVM